MEVFLKSLDTTDIYFRKNKGNSFTLYKICVISIDYASGSTVCIFKGSKCILLKTLYHRKTFSNLDGFVKRKFSYNPL
jgi:hypothetical protein